MKNIISSIFGKVTPFLVCCLFTCQQGMAQLPTCSGSSSGLLYFLNSGFIYNFDPTQPVSASNPVANTIPAPPNNANFGLTLGPNLNAAAPSPTFYVIGSGNVYYYYNGTTWVSTGFTGGTSGSGFLNPGAGGNFIYNLSPQSGQVYVYNGTGNSSFLVTIPGFAATNPNDVAADCLGDFYLLKTASPQYMYEYNPSGTLINSWNVTGAPNLGGSGGLAIINNTVYVNSSTNLYSGPISGGAINFSLLATNSLFATSDFASCPVVPIGGIASRTDTAYVCSGGSGTTVTTTLSTPLTWSVVSGPAVITGSGVSVNVTAASNSVIVAQSGSSSNCVNVDTFRIIVPTATVSTGLPISLSGCGVYQGTLNGHLMNTTPGFTYNINWTPALSITSGATTLTPAIRPVVNTKYTLSVSTPANQGGCIFTDTGTVYLIDKSVHANFSTTVKNGCSVDTVIFINQSVASTSQLWDFGNNITDTATNPVHVFTPGVHSVKLTVTNSQCIDSTRKTVDPPHPIKASFTVSADTICQNKPITFTNTSIGNNPTYLWIFGNGTTDTNATTLYTYTHSGKYLVKLVEKDFVPCYDTASIYVYVDSVSFNSFSTSDSVLCQGKAVTFTGHYINIGYKGNIWDFGDGTVIGNKNPIQHAYELSGTYPVSLTAKFRVCPDTTFKKSITVRAYPTLNIGSDTAMCPNANAILIGDNVNGSNKNASWLWNTGDTSAIIFATQPGLYYATISVNGCSTSDTLLVRNDCYLAIPNTFTPNNDGVNDYFFPRQRLSSSVIVYKMDIYNRWGQIIYETKNIDGRGWDGKFNSIDQPEGVYIYMIDVTFRDGETEHYKGNVTLLR